jgi:hypothetical protein
MVNQLSTTPGADQMSPRTTPQSPAASRTVEPGLLYIDGAWRQASDGGTAQAITPIDESEITTVAQATESDVEWAVAAATASDEGLWPQSGTSTVVHPTGHRRIRYQPVAEQTPVLG